MSENMVLGRLGRYSPDSLDLIYNLEAISKNYADPENWTVESVCGPRMLSTPRRTKTHCDLQASHLLLLTSSIFTADQRSKLQYLIQQLDSL